MRLRWVAGTGRVFEFKETIGMAGDETLADEFDDDATDDIDQFEEKQEVQAAPVKDPDPVTIERRDGPVAGRTTPTEKDEEFSTAGGGGGGGFAGLPGQADGEAACRAAEEQQRDRGGGRYVYRDGICDGRWEGAGLGFAEGSALQER